MRRNAAHTIHPDRYIQNGKSRDYFPMQKVIWTRMANIHAAFRNPIPSGDLTARGRVTNTDPMTAANRIS
jgi:hypothetical protein